MSSATFLEQRLIKRAQRGDKGAFDGLAIRYQTKLHNVIKQYVNEPAEIADISQDVLLKLYRSLKSFRGDSSFYTWMYRIAVNTSKTHLINKGRRPPDSDIAIEEAESYTISRFGLKEIATPECQLMREQVETALYSVVASLPDELRTTIMLRELEGLSYEEIADVMGCPIGTIRSRIFRARETIDNHLKPFLRE